MSQVRLNCLGTQATYEANGLLSVTGVQRADSSIYLGATTFPNYPSSLGSVYNGGSGGYVMQLLVFFPDGGQKGNLKAEWVDENGDIFVSESRPLTDIAPGIVGNNMPYVYAQPVESDVVNSYKHIDLDPSVTASNMLISCGLDRFNTGTLKLYLSGKLTNCIVRVIKTGVGNGTDSEIGQPRIFQATIQGNGHFELTVPFSCDIDNPF